MSLNKTSVIGDCPLNLACTLFVVSDSVIIKSMTFNKI